MGVSPAGAGLPELSRFQTTASVMPFAPAGGARPSTALQDAADTYVLMGPELSKPDLATLTTILDPPSSSNAAAQIEGLLEAAISAASAAEVIHALDNLTAIVSLDPHHAPAILSDRRLDPIRENVETMLNRMAAVAKLDAEARVGEAAKVSETIGGPAGAGMGCHS